MGKLYDQLKAYGESDYYPYHMPGHKRQELGTIPNDLKKIDITEIDGFDNLHQPEGILRELQQKAAALYGAEESFYMVNGSTGGILSAVSAALPAGGHLLMARNCHKSAYHAAYLRNLTISFLYPEVIPEYDIYDAVTPKQVKDALDQEKEIGAVLLVSPTYEGRTADIRAIAQAVHEKGIPLIVDEAHGAHLGFDSHFAPNSCKCGADIVIHSVHKTLPAMTQTALLHVNGDRIDRELLKRFLHIYQTSSPSYVLMASIEDALDCVEQQGGRLFSRFAESYLKMLERLSTCRYLKFLPAEDGKQDLGKLVISTKKIELSGQQLYDILLQEYHLQLEMAADSYCLAMFTVGDGPMAYERMTRALLEIDGRCKPAKPSSKVCMKAQESKEAAIPLFQAWDKRTALVPLEQAIGKIAGEFVNLYPPGVPVLVPGEVLTAPIYESILSYLEQNLNVQGVIRKKGSYHIKVLI